MGIGVGLEALAAMVKKRYPKSKEDQVRRLLSNISFEYRQVDNINPMPIYTTRKRDKLIRLLQKRHNFKFERDPNRDVLVFNSMNRIGIYNAGDIEIRIQGVKFTLEESLEIFTDEFIDKLGSIDDDMAYINKLTVQCKERDRRKLLKNVKL